MALVTTPSAADATSYSSVAAALARAALDPRGATFAGLASDALREPFLAMATIEIDGALLETGRLIGDKAVADQALELPRGSDTTIDSRAVLATQLLAFHLAERHALGEIGTPVADTGNVKRDKTDVLETEYFAPSAGTSAFDTLPAWVRALLTPLLSSTTVRWGSGIARRAS